MPAATKALRRKRRRWRQLRFFLFCQLFFGLGFCFLLTYYGPFDNLRNYLVTTAMSTMEHQYLVTWFLPKATIQRIMEQAGARFSDERQELAGMEFLATGDASIEVKAIKEAHFSGQLLVVHDPSRLEVGLSPYMGERGVTLSAMAREAGAVAGVNAGGFQNLEGSDAGGYPMGIVIQEGKIIYAQEGLSHYPIAGFNRENALVASNGMTLSEIEAAGLRCAVSFGPVMVVNGKLQVLQGGAGRQPRTVIGQRADGAVLLLAIDGRTVASLGATFSEAAQVMLAEGAVTAVNLDGGSSTTMWYDGQVINNPSDILGERSIPSAFLVR